MQDQAQNQEAQEIKTQTLKVIDDVATYDVVKLRRRYQTGKLFAGQWKFVKKGRYGVYTNGDWQVAMYLNKYTKDGVKNIECSTTLKNTKTKQKIVLHNRRFIDVDKPESAQRFLTFFDRFASAFIRAIAPEKSPVVNKL